MNTAAAVIHANGGQTFEEILTPMSQQIDSADVQAAGIARIWQLLEYGYPHDAIDDNARAAVAMAAGGVGAVVAALRTVSMDAVSACVGLRS